MSFFREQWHRGLLIRHPNTILLSLAFFGGLLVFLLGGWVWLAYSPLEESITARGEIIPEGKLRRVMTPVPGVVAAVHVAENQPVKQGDLLVELSPASTTIDEESLLVQRSHLQDEADTLLAALDGGQPALSHSTFGSIQYQWIQALRQTMVSELEGAERSIQRLTQELGEAKAQQEQLQKLFNIQQKKVTDYQALFDKGGLSRNELRQVQQEATGVEGDLNRVEKTILSRQEALAEARLKPEQLEGSYHQRILDRLTDVQQQMAVLDRDLNKADLTRQYQQIVAPESGVVHELALHGKDEVVGTGDVLISLVPSAMPLVAEVKVPNTDLGFVHMGQSAFLTLDAFPVYEFGRINGQVSGISPSTLKDEKGYPFYLVRITLDKTSLSHIKHPEVLQPVKPGMTITANLVTRNKTLLSFFTEPITTHFNRAFRDPSTRN